MTDYQVALRYMYPDAQWIFVGDAYDGLNWLDDAPKPSQADLDAAWPQVQHDLAYAEVERARKSAYERDADPVFFRWQRGDATEQDWLDAVQAVKDAHPYPEPA